MGTITMGDQPLVEAKMQERQINMGTVRVGDPPGYLHQAQANRRKEGMGLAVTPPLQPLCTVTIRARREREQQEGGMVQIGTTLNDRPLQNC